MRVTSTAREGACEEQTIFLNGEDTYCLYNQEGQVLAAIFLPAKVKNCVQHIFSDRGVILIPKSRHSILVVSRSLVLGYLPDQMIEIKSTQP